MPVFQTIQCKFPDDMSASHPSFLTVFLSSGTAAAFSKTIVAPLERVKLLLQLQDAQRMIAPENRYRGFCDCIHRTYKEQGLKSLWRGNGANVLRYFPYQALNFTLKDVYKKILVTYSKNSNNSGIRSILLTNLASGGVAGATALSIVYPLEFARTRLALDVGHNSSREFDGIKDCFVKIFRSDGVRGFYRGFIPSIQCIFVYRAAYFGTFDTIKTVVTGQRHVNMNFFVTWAVAQAVTIGSSYIAYPWDTVRRRVMMQSGRRDILYKNSWDCTVKMIKLEGAKSLYKGALSNVFRSTGGALILTFYDQLMKYFG